MKDKQLSYRLFDNPITRMSLYAAVTFFVIMAILLGVDHFGIHITPILGMLGYVLLPVLLLTSLAIAPLGMYVEWRRRHREAVGTAPKYPRVDLNDTHQRKVFYAFIIVSIVVGIAVVSVSYSTYEYTEEVEFCAEMCHKVMEPEAVTYSNSPHANVACVDCHVGKGATWYVRSKLSGLYQVYATIFNRYPRPILTPVENLRPARDTCQKCHWPEKFFGSFQKNFIYFNTDEANTKRVYPILINVGGGVSPTGIHWHVDPNNKVSYYPADRARQTLPYVKVEDAEGNVTEYIEEGSGFDLAKANLSEMRTMDCIDCHNRPTHMFKSPNKAMNDALAWNEMSPTIPFIKKMGLEVLEKNYPTDELAVSEIKKSLSAYYAVNHKPWLEKKGNQKKLDTAIARIQKIYTDNNFDQMKSYWKLYPNNIGHKEFPGCMRCHGGNHVSKDGKKISHDCNVCHVRIEEELVDKAKHVIQPQHPVDIGDAYFTMRCSDCHAQQ